MENDASFVRDLCDLEVPSDIHFSPNGKQIIYATALTLGSQRGQHPVSTIWLASTTEAFSSRALTTGDAKDSAPAWHPNGKDIAYISDRAEPGVKWAIYLQDVIFSEVVKALTPVENKQPIGSFKFSPDGSYIAYASADEKSLEQEAAARNGEDAYVYGQDWAYARLRTVDTDTSEIRTLALDRHVLEMCWSPDGLKIAIVTSNTTEFEDRFVNGSTISIVDKDLTTVRDVFCFPNSVKDLLWGKDGKLYFWSGVAPWKKFGGHGVYSIDPKSADPVCEHVAFGIENDAVGLIDVSGEAMAHVQHGLEDSIVNVTGTVLYSKGQELLSFDVGSSGQHTQIALATSDINHPAEVYVTTKNGKSTIQLSNHGVKFRDQTFGTCHYLSCPSSDGEVKLDSLYLEPTRHTKGSKPFSTIVLIHGGPNIRLTNSFDTYLFKWTPYLLSIGIGVLIPSYRGSTGRGEKFGSYAIGGVGVQDYADIITSTQHAIDLGLADPARLVVGGWSHGGLLTNLCCVRNGLHGKGWKFNAAISGASISDIDSMALSSDMGCSYQPELHHGGVIWNMDMDDLRCRKGSALWAFKEAMEKSKKEGIDIIPPILILHGEEDTRTPVTQAVGLRRALQSHSLPFEMVLYPRQGHFFHERNFLVDMAYRVGQWCKMVR